MGVFGKLIDTMRINPDPEEDEYYDDDVYEEEAPKQSFFSKFKSEPADDYDEPEKNTSFSRNRVTTPTRRSMEVSMIKPTGVEDSKDIVNRLLDGKAVVLNMEGVHTEIAQRILDFTTGATYSMNGKLQKISNFIFIATPMQVELSGDFQDLLNSVSYDASGMNMKI